MNYQSFLYRQCLDNVYELPGKFRNSKIKSIPVTAVLTENINSISQKRENMRIYSPRTMIIFPVGRFHLGKFLFQCLYCTIAYTVWSYVFTKLTFLEFHALFKVVYFIVFEAGKQELIICDRILTMNHLSSRSALIGSIYCYVKHT